MRSLLALVVALAATAGGGDALAKSGLGFVKSGSGPAVVLLHTLGGDSSVWEATAAHLKPTHTVLTVDLPGHGASGAPADRAIDLDGVAGQVATLLRDEKLAPAVLVGHGVGALVAARVPLVDPGAVRGLVLIDPMLARAPIPDEKRAELRLKLVSMRSATLRMLFQPIAASPAQVQKLVRTAEHVAPDLFVTWLDATAENELGERAARIRVPVAAFLSQLFGDGPDDRARTGLRPIPQLTVERFPASHHWLFWDEPQHFERALDAFLAKVEH